MSFDITNKEQGITAVVFSGDGKLLLVGDTLGCVSVYGEMLSFLISLVKGCTILSVFCSDTTSGASSCLWSWQAHQGEVFNITYLAARNTVVTLGADCKVVNDAFSRHRS